MSRSSLTLALLLAAASTFVTSCAPMPMNADEFRARMPLHRRGRVERWIVPDRASDVLERLDTAYTHCVDRQQTFCSQGCVTMTHHHTVLDAEGTRRTIVVQNLPSGHTGRRVAPGGTYEMLVDVVSQGRSTEVTWIGGDHDVFAPYVEATQRWSHAIEHPVRCPED